MAKPSKPATTRLKSVHFTTCALPVEVAFGSSLVLVLLLEAVWVCVTGVLVCQLPPEVGEIDSVGELALVAIFVEIVCVRESGMGAVLESVALGAVLMD